MLKLPDNKDEALEMAGVAVETLNVIAQIVGGAASNTAAGVITVVRVILASLQEGFDGKITADQVRKDLKKFANSIDINDAAADSALDKKFTGKKD